MSNLTVTEFCNLRVLTTQQLADSYETDAKVISNNFNRNKDRYVEGKHYILLEGEYLKEFLQSSKVGTQNESMIRSLYLWTEKGAFLHAKSLNTDKAWEVYDILVDTYFKVKQPKSHIQLLEMELEAIKEVSDKVDSVNTDLQAFKMDMPILGLECDKITCAVKSRGVKCLGGKQSNAYSDASLRGRVYSDIYGQLKREFGVGSYKAIKRSQTEIAVGIINGYDLPIALGDEINDANAQLVM